MSGLFGASTVAKRRAGQVDIALLHRLECSACPLNEVKGNLNPHMPATGTDRPLVYILGEAPGKDEDEDAEQFVGKSGQLLRANIPRDFKGLLRFNNVVRTRPPKNATPGLVEIECCRPSVVADIERTRPRAIFGFGNVPLNWMLPSWPGQRISLWRGRRMPVKVGSHVCWYYPFSHPAYLLRQREDSDETKAFRIDLKRAFAEVDDLPTPVVHTPEQAAADIEVMTRFGRAGLREIADALDWAAEQPLIGVDYETTGGVRPYGKKASILSAAVATKHEGFAFGFDHPECEWSDDELLELTDIWEDFLRRAKGRKAVHHLGFELEWTGVFVNRNLLRAGRWDDTASQAHILDERKGEGMKAGPYSLEWLVQQYFGINLKQLSNVDTKHLAETPLPNVLLYNGMDAKYHAHLFEAQHERIVAEGLEAPYELAVRKVATCVLAQIKGAPVDQTAVKAMSEKYGDRIKELDAAIEADPLVKKFRATANRIFNALSGADVIHLFHNILKCKECEVVNKYTKETKLSCDEEVLEAIAERTKLELPTNIIKLRKATKQKSTYIDPLEVGNPVSVVWPDGQLHSSFNTIFTTTGRLSSDSPNLQNFPKRDGEAKEVRQQIIPVQDCICMAFDYGQIEARVIAMFTRDKRFVQALWENYDVHMEWAERIARAYPARIGGKQNLTDKKAMKDFRTDIKNQWTFPLFFGAKMESVAGFLNIPPETIKPLYNEFWKQFSPTKDWQDDLLAFYEKNGYTECLTGRRRRYPLSLNEIINSPVQGTAAEIVMDGMCRLSELNDWNLQPEIQIHDDLTFLRIPADRADEYAEKIITEMLAVPFPWVNVPIQVEASFGPNWLEQEEFGRFASHEWFANDNPRSPHYGKVAA